MRHVCHSQPPGLILRPFTADDVTAVHSWCGDPHVMRYVPSGPDQTLDDTAHRLAFYADHQARYGYSKWAITLPSGELIGDAGLIVRPDWIDLGFRLATSQWGQGYATEAASAWVRAAHDLGLSELGAFVHPEHIASQRVLEKLGFVHVRDETVCGMPARVYRYSVKSLTGTIARGILCASTGGQNGRTTHRHDPYLA